MSGHGNSVDVTLDIAQEADLPGFKKALQRAFALAVAEEMGSTNATVPADEDTLYFEKRNIHFYVNKCGFKIVDITIRGILTRAIRTTLTPTTVACADSRKTWPVQDAGTSRQICR